MKCAYCDTLYHNVSHCPACGAPAPAGPVSPPIAPPRVRAPAPRPSLSQRQLAAAVIFLCTGIPGTAILCLVALFGFSESISSFDFFIAFLCLTFAACFAVPVVAGGRILLGKGRRFAIASPVVTGLFAALIFTSGISVFILLATLAFAGALAGCFLALRPQKPR